MKIPKFLDDLAIISKLGDNPGADNGLGPNGLKAKFDEAALKIQTFINSIVDTLNTEFADNGPIYTAVSNANDAANTANSAASSASNAAAAASAAAERANASANALPITGGDMEGAINMNGQPLSGLNSPTANDQAANKGYVDTAERNAKDYAEQKKLTFASVSVPASAFVADTTYENYPFRAAVALEGVISSMIPDVTFALADAVSGNFAPVEDTYDGGVYLYTAEVPEADFTVPTIICWRGA